MRRHFNPSVYTKASNNLSRQWQRKKNKQIPPVRAAFHALNEKHTFCLLFTLVINSILDFVFISTFYQSRNTSKEIKDMNINVEDLIGLLKYFLIGFVFSLFVKLCPLGSSF
jgi:hypothetical protein